MAYNGSISVQFADTLTTPADLETVTSVLSRSKTATFTDGTGLNKAQKRWSDTRTLAASASENLDLYGSLTDAFGVVINFIRIKGLYVAADPTNTNDVLVGGAAANQFTNWVSDVTDIVRVKPGGFFLTVAPDAVAFAVTSGTGDQLKVANAGAGTPVNYDIILIGE